MHLIERNIRWIMLVSGTLTSTMLYAAIAPREALQSTFGAGIDGAPAELLVRNWGVLIAIVGGLLLYGAFDAAARKPALIVAGISKAAFVALVLSHGTAFLAHQAGVAVAVDSAMVLVFAAYLAATRGRPAAA